MSAENQHTADVGQVGDLAYTAQTTGREGLGPNGGGGVCTVSAAIPDPRGAPGVGPLCLCADWVEMRFVHYAFDPGILRPHVPVPLDLFGGRAYVSLVLFHLRKMRPHGTGFLGRACFRAISDHPFLNLRTYVEGAVGPGIHFLA